VFFKNLDESSVYARLNRAVSLEAVSANETRDLIYDAAADMVAEAEKFSLRGDLWELFFAMAVLQDENAICRTYERKYVPPDALWMLAHDLWIKHKSVTAIKNMAAGDELYEPLRHLADFAPQASPGSFRVKYIHGDIVAMAAQFASAASPEDMARALGEFCALRGAGKFALDCAFVWDSRKSELVPIDDIDPWTLDSLI